MAGILVVGELADGELQSITGELLAVGRELGEALDEEVAVALLGSDPGSSSSEAIARGADKVYLVQDSLLTGSEIDAHLAALQQVCGLAEPTVVLVGRTAMGRDLGPRLAFRLGVTVAQDCVEVSVDAATRRVQVVRPVYGGNAVATFTFLDAVPQVVVVRAKVYEPPEPDASRRGEVINTDIQIDPSVIKAKLVETVRQESEGVRLEDAPVVIGGGRGLGGPVPFELLTELAQLLGGAMGASRAACDAGWLDHSFQIGLTGKTISPNMYITIGISGASQHLAGCSGAKHIIAINRDADANIFKSASFGVVGDWNNVLPSFMETVRELLEN